MFLLCGLLVGFSVNNTSVKVGFWSETFMEVIGVDRALSRSRMFSHCQIKPVLSISNIMTFFKFSTRHSGKNMFILCIQIIVWIQGATVTLWEKVFVKLLISRKRQQGRKLSGRADRLEKSGNMTNLRDDCGFIVKAEVKEREEVGCFSKWLHRTYLVFLKSVAF